MFYVFIVYIFTPSDIGFPLLYILIITFPMEVHSYVYILGYLILSQRKSATYTGYFGLKSVNYDLV